MVTNGGLIPASRHDIAWAVQRWHALLAESEAGPYAARSRDATLAVVVALGDCETMRDLLRMFVAPTLDLTRLVIAVCTWDEIHLAPEIVLGAACALHLPQLIEHVAL
jgi:hypothetical protein